MLLIDKEQNGNAMKDFIFNDKKWDSSNYNNLSFKNAMSQYKNQQVQFDKVKEQQEKVSLPDDRQKTQINEDEEEKANLSD